MGLYCLSYFCSISEPQSLFQFQPHHIDCKTWLVIMTHSGLRMPEPLKSIHLFHDDDWSSS